MNQFSRTLPLLCAFSLLVTGCSQRVRPLPGHIPQAVRGLTPVGPVPGSTPIDLTIGLPIRNAEALDVLLNELYDPQSSNFRKYLTPSQFVERFAPTQASFESLLNFARRNNVEVIRAPSSRKFVHVRAAAGVINKVFHVTLLQYKHPSEDRLFYAPDREPAIEFDAALSHVTGLDSFRIPGRWRNQSSKNGAAVPVTAGGSGSGGRYVGGDFRTAYAPGVLLTGAGQVVGILELYGYNASDISAYTAANKMPDVTLQNVYLDDYTGTGTTGPNLESAADIELVISMAPGLSKVVIYGAPYTNAGVHDVLDESLTCSTTK